MTFFPRLIVLFILVTISSLLFFSQPTPALKDPYVRMYYFYSRDCKECLEIKDGFIPALKQKYGDVLEVRHLEINEPENYELLSELEKKSRPLKNPPPAIFIGNEILDGKEEIKERLEGLIKNYISKGGCDWPFALAQKEERTDRVVIEKFKNLGIPIVVGAGLLDGINPCAFTTIIFLISYLAFIGRKGRDLLFVGWAFTSAVFMTYLLIGLGLFEIIKRLTLLSFFNRIVSLLIGGIAGFLGVLSIYDYYKIKKGKIKDIVLQLPQSIKDKIHLVIRQESKARHFILASLLLGCLVALLEFPCTGQVYFPIIFVLRHTQDLRLYAFFYLVLYNLMFILPLIAVFIFAYKGMSSQAVARLMQENAGKVKILTAILFFTLATILVSYGSKIHL